ncbi:hypothetical protein C8A03DRAFT_19248 [Achaetomium macrosporum]|uniref:Oxidoreductase AflY n=1 Tax=Achaetomium macrosporum TaxID=79813 RepID=A0AAN7C1P8_9PEZI|nr:hypothetical protein C8A03DRAFT_19248 [Achaetomium macrosporum]
MAALAIRLSPTRTGIFKAADVAPDVLEECNRLLEQNHKAYHIFYRDPAFHNHMAHSLLTNLSLGASVEELRDRYNDLVPIQREIPPVDDALVGKLTDPATFYDTIGQIHQYHTFLEFFRREIDAKGWKPVVLEYVFARTKLADRMLAQVLEGAYHPVIHLGLGVEFEQPAIVAEALAQAASHDRMHIETLFFDAETKAAAAEAKEDVSKPLIDLVHETRAHPTIRHAARWSDLGNKMKDGVIGRAVDELAGVASQFRIDDHAEAALERRAAEMMSVCAYLAGASPRRPGRKRKIDFFLMHSVTSSIFVAVLVRQTWIPLEDRVRLVEWKARLDLAWYAATGCAELDPTAISAYSDPGSNDMGWEDLFREVRRECDDGHAAKFIRALKYGELLSAKYESSPQWKAYFPVRGDMWLKVARLCRDTTRNLPWELKWVFFTGFEQGWERPDLAQP